MLGVTMGKHTDESETVSHPTVERLRRAGDDYSIGSGHSRIVTMRDSPFERAKSRGAINDRQYAAGMKYFHHWYHAGLSAPLGSIDLNRIFASDVSGFSGMAKTETQAFHRQRYREAVQDLGKDKSSVIERIICQEHKLEDIGHSRGWANKPQAIAVATELMRLGLDRLTKLWGI
jgi:hypothetical protein